MTLGRLRAGELLALVGAVGLLVVLSLNWFEPAHRAAVGGAASTTGWASLGWLALALLVLSIAATLLWIGVTATHEAPALPVAGAVWTTSFGLIVLVIVAVRLVFQPGLDVGLDNAEVTVRLPAYLGLVCALAIGAGGWIGMADERLEAPASRPPEIPLRPIPPTS